MTAAPELYVRVDDDQNFPHDALEGCETALILFAAAFHGDNDARWIRDAGLVGTCVDTDGKKLTEMRVYFPRTWEFIDMDVYRLADEEWSPEFSACVRVWDVVTLDPFTNQFQRCADAINTWCRLARHRVIIGTGPNTSVTAPEGWRITGMRERSKYAGGVYWTILERT